MQQQPQMPGGPPGAEQIAVAVNPQYAPAKRGLQEPAKKAPPPVEVAVAASTASAIATTTAAAVAAKKQKRRSAVVQRHYDEPKTTVFCLRVANAHIQQSRGDANVMPVPSLLSGEAPSEPADSAPVYSMYSNARSMHEFDLDWQKRSFEAAAKRRTTIILDHEVMQKPTIFTEKKELPLDFLKGQNMQEKMRSLFDPAQRFYNSTVNEGQPEPLDMPVDSSHHIARLLVLYTPSRPFRACANSKLGICQATETMRHPAAPEVPMIAYYTESDYLKVSRGEPLIPNMASTGQDEKLMVYEQLCETCYRDYVSKKVQESKHQKHTVQAEVPFRYYQIGVGEYSKDGMYQQAHLTKSNFSHGIVGNMRLWTTKDFLPVMMRFTKDYSTLLECVHYDEYCRKLADGQLDPTQSWFAGWRETGPFYQLDNENSLRPVKETQPYMTVFCTTAREPSVGTLLEDYFSRQHELITSDLWDYAHLFCDLYACLEDPFYLERQHYEPKAGRWKYFCVHPFEQPPPVETHRLYYIVLHKVNTLRKMLKPDNPQRLTRHIQQKILVYLSSYRALLGLMQKIAGPDSSGDYSDDALLSNSVPDYTLGVLCCLTDTVYPLPIYHHRNGDQQYYRYAVHRYCRDNPLELCQRFYTARQSPPSLYFLPFKYIPEEDLGAVVDEFGATQALECYEDAIQELKKSWTANIMAIRTYGVQFRWREFSIKKQRKQTLREVADEMAQATLNPQLAEAIGGEGSLEHIKQRQRKAVVRTLTGMSETIKYNFAQIDNWVDQRTGRYRHLLELYADIVFVPFDEAVAWLVLNIAPAIEAVFQDLSNFTELIPPLIRHQVKLDPAVGVNDVPWSEHYILLAMLIRVAVLEELHSLEPYTRYEIRQNLVLLRNSHLKLFRKIFEKPERPVRDYQLVEPFRVGREMTVLDYYFPYPERELHGGSLPDYVNGLEMVNFFADCGMDQFPWSKLQYKMPDRCCDVREYSMMLRNFCSDPTFYRWTLLVLRLSLSGLYKHCSVVPCFARSVSLDELFDQSLHESMKPTIVQFILDNESLVLNAMSESLCHQLELMPALLRSLNELYRDWFSWRVYANMDMTRHMYSVEGSFHSVQEVVFDRIHLKGMRTLFRLSEIDFVVWLCSVFKKADDNRHKTGGPRLPRSAAVPPTINTVIQNLVLCMNPNDTLDIRVLKLIGIKKAQLCILYTLYRAFTAQILLNQDQELPLDLAPFALNTKELIALVQSIPPPKYIILCSFFTLLRNYQSVRVFKIRNANILERQLQRIQQRTGATCLAEVPRCAFSCAFSFCCKHVKNSWSSKPGTLSAGFEDISENLADGIYICAKKIHQQADELNAGELDDGMDEDDPTNQTVTAKRKSDRELRRPICSQTEPFTVFLPGFMVEADGFKIPGTKRVTLSENDNAKKPSGGAGAASTHKKGKKPAPPPPISANGKPSAVKAAGNTTAKKQVFDLPLPGYWITPCCGIPFEYDFDRWTPAGYQCRFCPQGIALYNSFNELSCTACRNKVTNHYHLLRVFDDIYEMQFRQVVFCQHCFNSVFRIAKTQPLFSLLLQGINQPESIPSLLQSAS